LPPNFIGEFQPCFLAAPQQYAWYHISAPNQPSPHIGKKNTLVNTSAFATKIIAGLPEEISGFWGRASPEIIAGLPLEISGFWGRALPEIIAELPGEISGVHIHRFNDLVFFINTSLWMWM